jgi:hypothetical protein
VPNQQDKIIIHGPNLAERDQRAGQRLGVHGASAGQRAILTTQSVELVAPVAMAFSRSLSTAFAGCR